MPIYKGTTELKAYLGDHGPMNIYKGSTKVAGWHNTTLSGDPVSFSDTYNDSAGISLEGNTIQNGTPTPAAPVAINSVSGNLISHNADSSKSDTYALPALRKTGTVADTLNVNTGAKVLKNAVYQITGAESWLYAANDGTYARFYNLSLSGVGGIRSTINCLCSHAVGKSFDTLSALGASGFDAWTNRLDISVPVSILASVDAAGIKAWFAAQYAAGTPVTVQYQLATPAPSTVTAQDMETYYPSTVIETDSTVKPIITATVKIQE